MLKSRTPYQIFVSSTYTDLIEERQAAVEAILRAGHIPAGMELFAAQNKPQLDVIKEWIEESDIFCLILGARYGSIEQNSGKSYIECEYDHALALGKPVFSLVLDDGPVEAKIKKLGRKGLEQENQAALKLFHQRITNTLVRMVSNPDSIKVAIFESIRALERTHDIEGWVRAKDVRTPPQMGEELARLSAENARLSKELADANAARSKEELIDGKTVKEWSSVLSMYSFSGWDAKTEQRDDSTKVDLLSALIQYGHELGTGVSNAAAASPRESWLFAIASSLVSLGLAEIKKAPTSVYWQRIGLSSAGKRLYGTLMAQKSQGEGIVSIKSILSQVRAALKERSQAAPGSDEQTKAAGEPKGGNPATSVSRPRPRAKTEAKKKPGASA
jgi:hypothetical protein